MKSSEILQCIITPLTFSKPGTAKIVVIFSFSAAEIKHVDGHGGPDLLLGNAQAIVENLEELLRVLLLKQLVVEGVLGGSESDNKHTIHIQR